MSVKDSQIVNYLNTKINDSLIFTIQEKCNRLIGSNTIDNHFQKLVQQRESTFLSYFTNCDTKKQIIFSEAKNSIPYNGFSFFQIEYQGDFPTSLLRAYRKMNELNSEKPRKELKEKRVVLEN